MDKKEVGVDLSEDLTRESLIAISYPKPDEDPSPPPSGPDQRKTFNSDADVAEVVDSDDGSEKCRSNLISISYTQSPDSQGLPVSPGGQKVYP